MKPSNSKSIYAILCTNIEEIQESDKTASLAKCEMLVKLSNAALAIQMKEITLMKAQIMVQQHNGTHAPVEIRNVEGKGFDTII